MVGIIVYTVVILEITSRERPKSASYLRLKSIQGTTIGKIEKNIFFQKKVFGKKSRILPKNPERDPLGLLKVFLQTENFKKFKGVTFDRIQKLSEKCRIVSKKPQRGDPLVSPLLLEA